MLPNPKIKLKDLKKDCYRALGLITEVSPKMVWLNCALVLVQAALPVASLYVIRLLIELLVKQQQVPFTQIVPLIVCFCILQLLSAAAAQCSNYMMTIYQQQLTDHLSSVVLEKAVSVNLEYYENPSYHDTLHLAQQQSLYRATQLSGYMNALLLNSLSLVFLTGLFVSLHWVYALTFVGLSVPLASIKWYYGHLLYRLEARFSPQEREASYLHQVLTGVNYAKEVRVFGFGPSFIKKFRTIRANIFKEKKSLNTRLILLSLLAETAEVIVIAFIFIMLAKNAWQGTITAGVFVIYLQGFQRLQGSAKNFLQSMVQVYQQIPFLKNLFSFLDNAPKSTTKSENSFPQGKQGLSIANLSFTYPGTTAKVLDKISIRCKPGNMIAIVGENGSGKSTLVKLLARLYSPPNGSISIDTIAVGDIDLKSFRENTVFLFQDFEKYFLTVEENITLGSEHNNCHESTETAARLSGAHPFISKLINGYKTRLGRTFSQSEQLSGGQWQKLALARAFYSNPQLIVLDEPTSSIDAISEYDLFRNLKVLAKDKMVVLISHRLYNIKLADYIYVMHEGCIVEEGDFASLINSNGRFKHMYDKQKLD